jgi:stage V sporulation protein R
MVWEYRVKSRKAEDYRQMLYDSLYHPPRIEVDEDRGADGSLHLVHHFEGKSLLQEYIGNTMLGLEYLWGGAVRLETNELEADFSLEAVGEPDTTWTRVLYEMKGRRLTRLALS